MSHKKRHFQGKHIVWFILININMRKSILNMLRFFAPDINTSLYNYLLLETVTWCVAKIGVLLVSSKTKTINTKCQPPCNLPCKCKQSCLVCLKISSLVYKIAWDEFRFKSPPHPNHLKNADQLFKFSCRALIWWYRG